MTVVNKHMKATLGDGGALGNADIAEMLRRRAGNGGNDLAFAFLKDGESVHVSWTYQELYARALALAGQLRKSGSKGDRVVLAFPPGLDFLAGFFGCLYAGMIPAPAYPPHRARRDGRLPAMAADCGARLALTTGSLMEEIRDGLEQETALGAIAVLAVDDIEPDGNIDLERETETARGLAYLQYTSGSTSVPKGVKITHGNLAQNLRDLHLGFQHDERSVMVTWLPAFHDMGLIYGLLLPLYFGFPCYVIPPTQFTRDPICWLRAISKFRGTHSAAPNFAFDLCRRRITEEQRRQLDLASWEMALIAAEPIRHETVVGFQEQFSVCGLRPHVLTPGYGLAEATLKVSSATKGEPAVALALNRDRLAEGVVLEEEMDSPNASVLMGCGRSEIDTEVAIVDPETRQPCPDGRVGEIWVGGKTVADGYWKRTDTGFGRMVGDPERSYLKTGDLGFLRNGHLFVSGRIKDVIIIRGRNFYPQDIELLVERADDRIRPAGVACFGVSAEGAEGVFVVAELQRVALRAQSFDDLYSEIRSEVSDCLQIDVDRIVLVRPGGVPKTSSGKVQRQRCRESYLRGELPVTHEWTADSPAQAKESERDTPNGKPADTEEGIVDWMRTWLKQRRGIKVQAGFRQRSLADLGLDSMSAVEMISDLEKSYGCRGSLDAVELWNHPTIAHFAKYAAKQFSGKRNGTRETVSPAAPTDRKSPAATRWSEPANTDKTELTLEQGLARELELCRARRA